MVYYTDASDVYWKMVYCVADRTFKRRQVQQLAHELIQEEKTTN